MTLSSNAVAAMFLSLAVATICATEVGEAAAASSAREIKGRVVGANGTPVSAAVVWVAPASTVRTPQGAINRVSRTETREDGSFVVQNLSGMLFALRIEAKGYAPFTRLEIPAGSTVSITLGKGFSVSGVVRDRDTRAPILAASVLGCDREAARFGEAACVRAETEKHGRFTLADLPEGDVEIEVRAVAHVPAKAAGIKVPQPSSGQNPIDLFLEPAGRLAGRVLGSDGKPVDGAVVRVRLVPVGPADAARAAGLPAVTVQATGAFSFPELPLGRYQLVVEKKGCGSTVGGPFDVKAGSDRANLELRLDTGAALEVRVLDPDGKPIHGLAVEMLDAQSKDGNRGAPPRPRLVDPDQIHEGENGKYRIVHLGPGVFTVRLDAGERGDVERVNVELATGKTTDLGTVVVREGRSVSGRVIDGAGAPIEGAEVLAFWQDESGNLKSRRAKTKADGRYRVVGLGELALELVTVRARGFAMGEREGVRPGDTAVDFTLERTGSLAGRVESSSGQVPAAFRLNAHREGRRVLEELAPADGDRQPARSFTDRTGEFRVDDLDPGTYTLEVIAEGYNPATKSGLRVSAGEISDAGTLILEPASLLKGRVLDAWEDAPVAGALVRVEWQPSKPSGTDPPPPHPGGAVSAEDGSFAIEGLRAGVFRVTVDHPSFVVSQGRIEMQPDQDPPEYIARLVRGGTLSGTVFGAERQPVQGAAIRILAVQATMEGSRAVETGPDGRYTVDRLAPGTYRVTRQPDSGSQIRGVVSKTAVIREGETTTLDFDDSPRIVLSGTVLKGHEILGNAKLIFSAIGSALGESKSTDSAPDGTFTIGLDRGGTYAVSVIGVNSASVPGGTSTVKVVIPDQPEVQQDIVLLPNVISGRVTDTEGDRVARAIVHALRSGSGAADPARPASAQVNEDSTYRIEGIDPGTYRVMALAEGYRPAESYPVIVSEDAPAPIVDLALERGRILRGRVVDPEDRGIPNAMVVVAPTGQRQSAFLPSYTDAGGTFKMTAPADGPLDITAIPPGWAPARLMDVMPADPEDASAIVLRASFGGRVVIRVVDHDGLPVAGAQLGLWPTAAFLGSMFLAERNRPQPTNAEGVSRAGLLAPGDYSVVIYGRQSVTPVRVTVEDGVESTVLITLH